MFNIKLGAITFLEESNIKEDTIIDMTLLANNIQKIYKTMKALASNFDISDFESIEDEIVKDLKESSGMTQNIQNTSSVSGTEYTELQRYKY